MGPAKTGHAKSTQTKQQTTKQPDVFSRGDDLGGEAGIVVNEIEHLVRCTNDTGWQRVGEQIRPCFLTEDLYKFRRPSRVSTLIG